MPSAAAAAGRALAVSAGGGRGDGLGVGRRGAERRARVAVRRRAFHDRLSHLHAEALDLGAADADLHPLARVERDLATGVHDQRAADQDLQGGGLAVGAHADAGPGLDARRARRGDHGQSADRLVDLGGAELDGDVGRLLGGRSPALETQPGVLSDADHAAPAHAQAGARGGGGAKRVAHHEPEARRHAQPAGAVAALDGADRFEQRRDRWLPPTG